MRIVIDARTGDGTGISRYSLNLLRELEKLPSDHEYIVLLGPIDYEKWTPKAANFRKIRSPYRHYSLGEQLGLAWQLYRLRPDLVHFTNFNAPLLYFGRRIFTIHDLTLVHYKNIRNDVLHRLVYPIKYWAMRLALRSAVMRSEALIVPSKYVQEDILQTWSKSRFGRVRAEKVHITPEAVEVPAKLGKTTRPMQDDYLLYVGAAYPHKNLDVLVKAYERVREQQPNLKLVIIGKQDYWQEQLKGLAPMAIFPGYVPYATLIAYYQHASLFVFPSLSEGFGLTPLEAMAYGAPVLSSNRTSIPEACGEAAEYFDPKSVKDLSDKITGLLDNPKKRASMVKRGEKQVAKFSWKKMAEQTLAIYQYKTSKK